MYFPSIHFNEGGNSLYNFSQHSYQNTPGALGNTSGDLIGEANNSSQPRPLPFRPAPLPPKSLYSTIGGYNGE